jgi:hypothetical protein
MTTITTEEFRPLLASMPDARRLLGGISNTRIYGLVNEDELVKVNIGRRGFITMESIDDYLARLKSAAAQAPKVGKFGFPLPEAAI